MNYQDKKTQKISFFSECNCHGHADACMYNATVDRLGLSMNLDGEMRGGGVCIDCKVIIV